MSSTAERSLTEPVVHRTPRSVLALCFAFICLEGYDMLMFGTVVPSLLAYEPWHLTPTDVGRLGSAAVVGMLVGALVTGGIADRIGRRLVLVGCVSLFSLGSALCAVAADPTQLGILRFVVGFGAGGLMPAVISAVVEFSPTNRRSLNSALAFAGVGIGGALAGLLAIWVVPNFGFRVMFAIGAIPALILLPMALRLLPESISFLTANGRTQEAQRVADRFGISLSVTPLSASSAATPARSLSFGERLGLLLGREYRVATLLFWAATFLCLLVLFGASTWLPSLMIASGYGLSSSLAFLLVLNLGAALGTVIVAPIADRIGLRIVIVATFVMAAASFALLAVHPPTPVVVLLVALTGVGSTGTQVLLNTFVASSYPTQVRTTGLGLSLGIGRIGGVLGPILGASVITGLVGAGQFLAFAAPALLGALIVLAVPRRDNSAG